jgi:hypothetical protein
MKKIPALMICLATAVPSLFAQLPTGSLAPDFNVQDINGNYVHLYDILAEDKIVLMEVTATWCPPCWSYHNSGSLKDFYNQHGPAGDNKARVLTVEGDPATNVACLYGQSGCSDYSPGNWVAGTPYPIIDNSAIATSYQVTYYPTLFIICPNKRLITVGQLSPDDLWDLATTCPVAYGQHNAGIYDYTPGTRLYEICDTQALGPQFRLINLGATALTEATVQMSWDTEVVSTYQWTGNLATYEEAFISLNPYMATTPGTLITELTSVNNGALDADASNNIKSNSYQDSKSFNTQQILLKLRTDAYGAETYWELRDEQGNVLDYGGNQAVGPNGGGLLNNAPQGPGMYGNNVLIKDTLTVPGPGCYSIHFVDYYGDGMCCTFGNGYYRLYNLDNPAVPVISGGTFGAYDSRAFGVGTVVSAGTTPDAWPLLSVFPNPASDQVQIQLDLPAEMPVAGRVWNALGELVYQFSEAALPQGAHQWQIQVANWPPGIYTLQIETGKQRLIRRFVTQPN